MSVTQLPRDEQLVAQTRAMLRLLVELTGPTRVSDLPPLVSAIQRELRDDRTLSEFGHSLLTLRVQYSLRDGWKIPNLSDLITLALSMRWVTVTSGGTLRLQPNGEREVASVSVTAREARAVARVDGQPAHSVPRRALV